MGVGVIVAVLVAEDWVQICRMVPRQLSSSGLYIVASRGNGFQIQGRLVDANGRRFSNARPIQEYRRSSKLPLKTTVLLDMKVSQSQNVGVPKLLPCNVAQNTNEERDLTRSANNKDRSYPYIPLPPFTSHCTTQQCTFHRATQVPSQRSSSPTDSQS